MVLNTTMRFCLTHFLGQIIKNAVLTARLGTLLGQTTGVGNLSNDNKLQLLFMDNANSLHHLIQRSIGFCEPNQLPELLSNIILSGGNISAYDRDKLKIRLILELKILAAKQGDTTFAAAFMRISFARKYAVWHGATLLYKTLCQSEEYTAASENVTSETCMDSEISFDDNDHNHITLENLFVNLWQKVSKSRHVSRALSTVDMYL